MSAIETWGVALGLAFVVVWIWMSLDDKEPPGAP